MKIGLPTIAAVLIATGAMAQHSNYSSSNLETGQAQFAAIAEIVTILRDNPGTDWEQVDIGALRDHLVDMDNVTTKAAVETTINDLNVTFAITGDTLVAASIRRMVMAHSPMLQQATGWSISTEDLEDGANMLVQLRTMDELNEVTGLGFFGLMTIGAHHQRHHEMIARGHSPH